MIDEIIDMLDGRYLLRSYHFQLLLHSDIKRLNVNACRIYSVNKSALKTLSSRCQSLTHLKIRLPYEQYLEEQCTLLANMPQLISLDISDFAVNDEVLKVISENCPNLLDINMYLSRTSCDRVLLYFCNSPTHPKNLPKLRSLLITGFTFGAFIYGASVDTIVHLLNSQPSLQYLRIPGIDYAFEQMYGGEFQSLKEVPPEWIHNLLDITIFGTSGGEYKPMLSQVDRLNLTLQCCPLLTKLCLIDLEDPEILNNLSKLKHLTNLSVGISQMKQPPVPYKSRIFSTHMFSVLTKIGHNLISLECVGFVEVSLIIIGILCSKLESLTLDNNQFTSEHDLMEDYVNNPFPCFKNLKVIHISSDVVNFDDTTFVGEKALSLLFQNASEITEIALSRVRNLTDNVISSSNQIHSFRHLKKCLLIECSPISVESIWKLLSVDNPLKHLGVRICGNITRHDMDLVKQEAKLRQFNVRF